MSVLEEYLGKCYAVEEERTRRLKAANPEFVMAEVRKAIHGRREEIEREHEAIVMREEETLP